MDDKYACQACGHVDTKKRFYSVSDTELDTTTLVEKYECPECRSSNVRKMFKFSVDYRLYGSIEVEADTSGKAMEKVELEISNKELIDGLQIAQGDDEPEIMEVRDESGKAVICFGKIENKRMKRARERKG